MSDPIKTAPHKSSLGGLDANLMALLCYVAAFVIGLIPGIRYVAFLAPLVLYFLEKNSRFVKFHAMQAFILELLYMLLNLILGLIGTAVLAGSATSLIMGSAVGLGTAIGGRANGHRQHRRVGVCEYRRHQGLWIYGIRDSAAGRHSPHAYGKVLNRLLEAPSEEGIFFYLFCDLK